MLPKNRVSTHPGEILLEEFLKPMGISITKAAAAMGIHRVILSDTCHGRRDMSPRVCAIVAKATNTTIEFWQGLQSGYDSSKYLLSKEGKRELAGVIQLSEKIAKNPLNIKASQLTVNEDSYKPKIQRRSAKTGKIVSVKKTVSS